MARSTTRPADPDLVRLRAAMVAAGRRLGARGLIAASEGNLSVRLPGGRLLVTPAGLRKDELAPDDLLVVGIEADSGPADTPPRPGLRPTSDLAIHRAILAARPEVGAVIHAHLPASMALTLAGKAPDPAALPETALFVPRLPVVPFGVPGSADLAGRIAAALTEPPLPLAGAAILERHGAVAVGAIGTATDPGDDEAVAADPGDDEAVAADPTLPLLEALREALNRLELVEVLSRTWLDALLIRGARRP